MLPLTQNNRRSLPVTKYAPWFNPIIHRNSVTSNDYKIQIRAKARGYPLRFGFSCSNTCSHDYRHRIVLPRSKFSSPDRQIQSNSKQHKIPQFHQHKGSKKLPLNLHTLSTSDLHFVNPITFRISSKTCYLIWNHKHVCSLYKLRKLPLDYYELSILCKKSRIAIRLRSSS